jgi:hypothetical protein
MTSKATTTQRVPHRSRPAVSEGRPIYVMLQTLPQVPSLQGKKTSRIVKEALAAASDRLGARVRKFEIKARRIHLIVDAEDEIALARAMKGLSVRLARNLNRHTGESGRVMAERYDVRVLASPDEADRLIARWERIHV